MQGPLGSSPQGLVATDKGWWQGTSCTRCPHPHLGSTQAPWKLGSTLGRQIPRGARTVSIPLAKGNLVTEMTRYLSYNRDIIHYVLNITYMSICDKCILHKICTYKYKI